MGDQEREPKLFTLKEAERTRLAVEPILIEAIESRSKLGELAERLGTIANRIALSGGALVPLSLVVEVKERRIVVDAPEGLFELEE